MTRFVSKKETVIELRERNLTMLKLDLTMRNPLRLINGVKDGLLATGDFGAVLSRSGGGKTALTVQIAMNALLQSKNVLHLSLTDPVEKVDLWYQEVLSQIASQYSETRFKQLWDILLPHRLIMTLCTQAFTVATLEERLNDLSEQNIFIPEILVIDGFSFDGDCRPILSQLKNLAEQRRCHIWFTITTHRHEPPAENGYPVQLDNLTDLFKTILQLKSGEGPVDIRILKQPGETNPKINLVLDPNTLLIQNLAN
jgi:hypothetical protein